VDQLFQELDTNHDGMIDADEFAAMDANKDGRIDVADMTDHPSDYISVSRLQTELAFRDEKRTACQAATLFMLFNVIGYQLIVDNHVGLLLAAVLRLPSTAISATDTSAAVRTCDAVQTRGCVWPYPGQPDARPTLASAAR